jgi:hypothetical protein
MPFQSLRGHKPLEWLTFIFEVLTFVALCVYTYYAKQQWGTMSGQLDVMRATIRQNRESIRQSMIQSRAATTSAEAAKGSASTARDTLALSQRAYLAVGIIAPIPGGVKIGLNNFGRVPAKLIASDLTYIRISIPFTTGVSAIKQLETLAVHIPGGANVAPGAAANFAIMATLPRLSAENEAAVVAGVQQLAVFGRLRFNTGFGTTDTVVVNISRTGSGWTVLNEGIGIAVK